MRMQIGLVFFIAVFWGFFPVFTTIFTFPQERAMLAKERAVDMYRLSAYFMARILSDLPLDLILPIGFFAYSLLHGSPSHDCCSLSPHHAYYIPQHCCFSGVCFPGNELY